MKKPLISIITPTLNQGRYIETTILSVLEQRNANIEYIVVDAGSNDSTHSILRQYKSHLKWTVLSGKGQSSAINWGWKHAKGSILCWLNSDDVLVPRTLELVKEFFSGSAKIDVLYGNCDYINKRGAYLAPYPTKEFDYVDLVRNGINYIPQPSVFIRRQVFETIGVLDEGLNYVMDFDYWIKAGLHFEFIHVPDTLAQLRLHSKAKSIRNLNEFAKELVFIYKGFFARTDLPGHIRALKDEGLRNANFIAANISFWGGN